MLHIIEVTLQTTGRNRMQKLQVFFMALRCIDGFSPKFTVLSNKRYVSRISMENKDENLFKVPNPRLNKIFASMKPGGSF